MLHAGVAIVVFYVSRNSPNSRWWLVHAPLLLLAVHWLVRHWPL